MEASVIGSQITKFRKAKGMTQEELGRAVGVSTQAVSRWECGGAPDITLLPAIADHLGVSVDALFGREGGEALDMNKAVCNWFSTIPEGQVYTRLHRLIWTALSSRSPIKEIDEYLEHCTEESSNSLITTIMESESGLYFGVNAEDMAFATVCPKPQAGYRAYFGDNEQYREFFAALAIPGTLEILLYMLSSDRRYSTVELLAKNTGMDTAQLTEVLEKLETFHIMFSLEIDTLEGTTKVYYVYENGSYVPFLYLARYLMQGSKIHYVNYSFRKKPLLK